MAYTLEKARILLVDDMKPMLSLTKSVLKIFGFQDVHMAEDGEEAFQMACKIDPDLIVTDWMMDPINGLELTEMIRKNPLSPNPYTPILMMTGFSSRLRVEKARDMGITEFLVKPFSAQDLYVRIHQIIEKPRQFVDTGAFFGPDRRRKTTKNYAGPRRRDEDTGGNKKPTENTERTEDILRKLREEAKTVSTKNEG